MRHFLNEENQQISEQEKAEKIQPESESCQPPPSCAAILPTMLVERTRKSTRELQPMAGVCSEIGSIRAPSNRSQSEIFNQYVIDKGTKTRTSLFFHCAILQRMPTLR